MTCMPASLTPKTDGPLSTVDKGDKELARIDEQFQEAEIVGTLRIPATGVAALAFGPPPRPPAGRTGRREFPHLSGEGGSQGPAPAWTHRSRIRPPPSCLPPRAPSHAPLPLPGLSTAGPSLPYSTGFSQVI